MNRTIVLSIVMVFSFGIAGAQQPSKSNAESCGFNLSEKGEAPSVKGPAELVSLLYVVEQPDSPIEIKAIDLTGSQFSVSNGQYSWSPCTAYQVQNRSDRTVYRFEITQTLNSPEGGGFGAKGKSPLAAGEVGEVKICGGSGHGGTPTDRPRLFVLVSHVDFDGCEYRPSLRIPHEIAR